MSGLRRCCWPYPCTPECDEKHRRRNGHHRDCLCEECCKAHL